MSLSVCVFCLKKHIIRCVVYCLNIKRYGNFSYKISKLKFSSVVIS